MAPASILAARAAAKPARYGRRMIVMSRPITMPLLPGAAHGSTSSCHGRTGTPARAATSAASARRSPVSARTTWPATRSRLLLSLLLVAHPSQRGLGERPYDGGLVVVFAWMGHAGRDAPEDAGQLFDLGRVGLVLGRLADCLGGGGGEPRCFSGQDGNGPFAALLVDGDG